MSRDAIAEALFVDRGAFELSPAESPFVAIQRVVVRMLFDPAFVERVYTDAESALGSELWTMLSGTGLVEQLLENDLRLWNADRLRRSRALNILIDEFKVTTTLALLETRKLAFLDAFFSSRFFHDAVQGRGYMAIAFVRYLEDALHTDALMSPHLREALRMEGAMARSRRLLRDARRGQDIALSHTMSGPPGRRWATLPGVCAVAVPTGTIALIQHIERYLFEVSQVPALALCDDPPRPEPLPELSDELEGYLLEPQVGGKVELMGVDLDFVHIIEACALPTHFAALSRAVAPHGISPEDAADYAEQLTEGGVLRHVEVAKDGSVSA